MPKITVKVVDSKNKPVPFISVTVGPKEAPTRVDGVASLDISSGTHRLTVKSLIHKPFTKEIRVPPTHHDIQIQPARFTG